MQQTLNHLILAILLMAFSGGAYAAPKKKNAPRLVVTISLSKQILWISKRTNKKLMHLAARTLKVTPGTIRLGTFTPDKMSECFQSPNGNVCLENVIRFDRNKQIRSSDMFHIWQASHRPANRVVVLESETGSMLYTLVAQVGLQKTQIRVIP